VAVKRRWSYPEERAPCGEAGGLTSLSLRSHWDQPAERQHLADCLVSRPRPFALVIWEPLATKAPAPPKAQPHCCYIQSIIFYHAPYIVWPFKKRWRCNGRLRADRGGFFEWDQIESRLAWDDLVEFQGERFQVDGGSVVWARRRWWMVHGARRVRPA